MRVFPALTLFTACALLLPGSLTAQSLSEAAAKEKERRKGRTARTFTEDDLRRAGAARPPETTVTDSAPASDAAAPAKDGAAKEGAETTPKKKTEEETRAEQEKAWREKLAKASADVARLTSQVDGLQRSVNDLSQNLYGGTRAAQLTKLEEAKKQLATAQQAVADAEEEGRRSGFR